MKTFDLGPDELLREFIQKEPESEEERQLQGEIRAFCEAVLAGDEGQISRVLDQINAWDVWLEEKKIVYKPGKPWGWFDLEDTEDRKTSEVDKIRTVFVNFILSRPDRDAAMYLLGLVEKQKEGSDMITIGEIAKEVKKSQNTVRNRIYKAKKDGELKVCRKSGRVLLLDRAEALSIALRPDGRGRPKKSS